MINKNLKKYILFILFSLLPFSVAFAQEEPDITPPVISNVDIYMTSAVDIAVSWNTDERATSLVEYGTNADYGSMKYGENGIEHLVRIEELSPSTEYFFAIKSVDDVGNEAVSLTTFTTGDICAFAPRINFFKIENETTNSADLSWETDIPAISYLKYGLVESGSFVQIAPHDDYILKHYYVVQNLEPGKQYFIKLTVVNELGLASEEQTYYFSTLDSGGDNGDNGSPDSNQTPVDSGGHSHVVEEPCDDPVILKDIISTSDNSSPNKIQNIKVVSLDSLMIIKWDLPQNIEYKNVKILRKDNDYPKSLTDGIVVYTGSGNFFEDAGLVNGKTYYYALYSYDKDNNYTEPILFSMAPYRETRHFHVLNVSNVDVYNFSGFLKKDLKLGDKDDEVGYLQEILSNDPNIYPEGLVTNYFGVLTEKALKRVQEKTGLPLTGKLDEKTRDVVILTSAKQKITERDDIVEIKSLALDLKQGMKGESISFLQKYLVNKGFLKPELVTGYFGEMTKQAVVNFQQKNNIGPASGYVGPKTRAKILEDIKITDYLK